MLTKILIEKVILSQKDRLNTLDTGFPRQLAIPDGLTSHAFIVSGIRHYGKSTWLKLPQQCQNNEGKPRLSV